MSDGQIIMDLSSAPSLSREDFIVGGCNALAADWIDRWPDWPGRIKGVVIEGAECSGKSHLASIWQESSGASLLTALDESSLAGLEKAPHMIWDHPVPGSDWSDEILFHHLNSLTEIGGSVLVLTRAPISALSWSLADNNSRLRGLVRATITTPDDDMLVSLLYKHGDDLGLVLDSEVARYIVSRTDRSFKAMQDMVVILNDACLSDQRKLTIPMARRVLDGLKDNFEED